MIASLRLLPLVLGLAACSDALSTSTAEQALDRVTNGSFESANYAGWTLLEGSGTASAGTFGIANHNQTVNLNDSIFDHSDQLSFDQTSPGLPITYTATNGSFLAFQLQNAAERQRMYQTVTLPTCGSFVRWDMAYRTHAAFDAAQQYLAVNIRNGADSVLATPFKLVTGAPTQVSAMSAFQADISAFDGQTVRLDFEVQAANGRFDVAWDNIRIECDNPPIATPSASAVSFGNLRVGTAATPEMITVQNTGPTDLTISAITTVAPFSVTTATLPVTLMPNETTLLTVGFTPVATGFAGGAVSIVSNDQNSPTVIDLSGFGIDGTLTPDQAVFDFGAQRVGTTSPSRIIGISNTGNVDLVISDVTVAPPFTLVQTNNVTLPPNGTTSFEVTFSPTAAGPVQQNLVITTDSSASPTFIPLMGLGAIGIVDVMPAALSFGEIRAGLVSAPRPLTIRNTGSGPLTVTDVTTPAGIEIVGTPLPLTLLPGAEGVIELVFTPSAPGPLGGQLVVNTNNGDATVAVSGNAVPIALVPDPPVLELGESAQGESTNRAMIALTNVTGGPVTIANATIDDPRFTIDPPPPQIPIAPGESVVFGVRFIPDVIGPINSEIVIMLQGAGDADVAILVTGEGVTADGGGCCSSSGGSSSVWLTLVTLGLVLLRRRRPRHR